MLIQILLEKNLPISKLCSIMKSYPQIMINAKVIESKKAEYKNNERIQKAIKALEQEFSENGRVIIRPSGTEPLIRVMIEGEDEKYIDTKAKELVKILEEELN